MEKKVTVTTISKKICLILKKWVYSKEQYKACLKKNIYLIPKICIKLFVL